MRISILRSRRAVARRVPSGGPRARERDRLISCALIHYYYHPGSNRLHGLVYYRSLDEQAGTRGRDTGHAPAGPAARRRLRREMAPRYGDRDGTHDARGQAPQRAQHRSMTPNPSGGHSVAPTVSSRGAMHLRHTHDGTHDTRQHHATRAKGREDTALYLTHSLSRTHSTKARFLQSVSLRCTLKGMVCGGAKLRHQAVAPQGQVSCLQEWRCGALLKQCEA